MAFNKPFVGSLTLVKAKQQMIVTKIIKSEFSEVLRNINQHLNSTTEMCKILCFNLNILLFENKNNIIKFKQIL